MCQKGKTQNVLTQNLKHGVEKHVLWNTEGVIFGSNCSLSWLLSEALYYGFVEILPVIAVKAVREE